MFLRLCWNIFEGVDRSHWQSSTGRLFTWILLTVQVPLLRCSFSKIQEHYFQIFPNNSRLPQKPLVPLSLCCGPLLTYTSLALSLHSYLLHPANQLAAVFSYICTHLSVHWEERCAAVYYTSPSPIYQRLFRVNKKYEIFIPATMCFGAVNTHTPEVGWHKRCAFCSTIVAFNRSIF